MRRSALGLAVALSLFTAPVAHAEPECVATQAPDGWSEYICHGDTPAYVCWADFQCGRIRWITLPNGLTITDIVQ